MPVARKVWLPMRVLDAGGSGPPLNHAVIVLLPQEIGGEQAGAAGGRSEKRPVEVLGNAGGGEVRVEIQLQVVMTGDYTRISFLKTQRQRSANLQRQYSCGFEHQHCLPEVYTQWVRAENRDFSCRSTDFCESGFRDHG